MSASPVVNSVLIIAGDADGNLGDRAILYAICHGLRAVKPGLRITAISNTRAVQNAGMGIDTIRSGFRGFAPLIRSAIGADAIICGGGGLFQDDDSLIKMPYWALRVLLMRLFCRRIIGYSLGVGPLSAPTSRWSARLAFLCMRQITTRDPVAQATAQALTRKPVSVIPDPALLLIPAPANKAKHWLEERGVPINERPLIGVSVRRWFPPKPRLVPSRIASRFERPGHTLVHRSAVLCDLLARVLDQLVRKNDACILFLPTYNVSHEGDDRLCREIQNKMTLDPGKILFIDDPHLYKGVCTQLDVLLGGRMHPMIFAATVGTPVVGLAYNPKFHGGFSMLGLDQYMMDIQEFVTQGLTDELVELVNSAQTHNVDTTAYIAGVSDRIRAFNQKILGVED
jgi:polysaccharide pyruvyl transferase WcaK-like protein